MYVRGPTALAEPTKRLRLRRRIANMGPIAFVLAAAVLLVSFSLIPAIGHNDAASNVIFFAVCGALILVWIVCLNGFNSGRLNAPAAPTHSPFAVSSSSDFAFLPSANPAATIFPPDTGPATSNDRLERR